MTAAGDVSDYDDAAQADIADEVAAAAGVSNDDVTIHVEAGSVIITAIIKVNIDGRVEGGIRFIKLLKSSSA